MLNRNNKVLKQSFNIEEINIETISDFHDLLLNQKFDMYRGESNSKWMLNSSIVRKLKAELIDKSFVLDKEYLYNRLSIYKSEYDSKISRNHDYVRFLFYIQHSISLSPFIDITESIWVALSFALEKVQCTPTNEKQGDAVIYAFRIVGNKSENKSILSTQRSVQNILDKLSIGINKVNETKRDVESYIINLKDLQFQNDRMMYQKGSFLLLNNYSISLDNYSNQLNSGKDIKITKFILSKYILGELYMELREKHPKYSINYLYDPYLAFKNIDE